MLTFAKAETEIGFNVLLKYCIIKNLINSIYSLIIEQYVQNYCKILVKDAYQLGESYI